MILRLGLLAMVIGATLLSRAATPDIPFYQDRSEQFPAEGELAGATMKKVHVNKDGIVYVLTDSGMARLFGDKLALDRSFRPLIGKKILDSAVARGNLFYLLEDALISNGAAGSYAVKLPLGKFDRVAVGSGLWALVSGTEGTAMVTAEGKLIPVSERGIPQAFEDKFFLLREDCVLTLDDHWAPSFVWKRLPYPHATSIVDQTLIGTSEGAFFAGRKAEDLPCTNITTLEYSTNFGLWLGSDRGVFNISASRNYYASRRWLLDDHVVDLDLDRTGNVYVLTKLGLNKIVFEQMTLEQKAKHYQDKIRNRHIRFGFCSELRLSRPGDPTSAEMIDTDNDGTWTEYYLASQAFRYGATGDPEAHAHAWETFAAMERLESINSLGGFPARTFERKGYKVSDPDRWRDRGDGLWEWKGHTSSDEITAHAFGCSALYECAAKTPEEKARIAAFISKIVDHILRNNYCLIDVDGQPTLWARWNPEYVNWFPHSVFDRRLNSAEIVAILQFAYAITGKETYKTKGMELLNKHGYLENIMNPMENISLTKGYIHQGIELGTEWNHSDDLLAFDAYWVLYRYAFNSDLKRKYAAAIRNHWLMEKEEKNPLWNFVYASTQRKDFDLEGALWTLRRFPWDMTDWTVQNSHRLDITKLPENFRQQQIKELLPPGERRITRWNSQPFVLDGGSGGHIEFAGDEYLLPYWMGRYLKIIAPPESDSKRQPVWP